jgi:hypothetical protein
MNVRTYGPFTPMVASEHVSGTVTRETGNYILERETTCHDDGTVTVEYRDIPKS